MDGFRLRRAVAASTGALLILGSVLTAPASACDTALPEPVEAAAAAGERAAVFEAGLGRSGVPVAAWERRVIARAPALVPITSARAVEATTRWWGRPPPRELPEHGVSAMPYVWDIGSDCGRTIPPNEATLVLVGLAQPDGGLHVWWVGVGDGHWYFTEGPLSPAQAAALSDAFGPPTEVEVSTATRLRADLHVWLPHLITVAVVVALAVGWRFFRRRHPRRRRSRIQPPEVPVVRT